MKKDYEVTYQITIVAKRTVWANSFEDAEDTVLRLEQNNIKGIFPLRDAQIDIRVSSQAVKAVVS